MSLILPSASIKFHINYSQEKPQPIKIDVSELLSKVQKPEKKIKKVRPGSATVDAKSKSTNYHN